MRTYHPQYQNPYQEEYGPTKELVSWVHGMNLGKQACGKLLTLITSDDFGVRQLSDLLELEDEDINELKTSLPRAQRRKFAKALEKLKVQMASNTRGCTFVTRVKVF